MQDKNDIAKKLGYADYQSLVNSANRGETLISGGMINTKLIDAELIVTSALIAQAIKANQLNVNNNFIVNSDGTVSVNGIIHSLGRNTELVISDGYVRIMYKGTDVAKLSVNENTGMPELAMYKGNRSCVMTAEKIMLSTGGASASFLTIDGSVLGYGTIKKKSDGTLYLANNEYEYITVGIFASPSEGGTTIPSPSSMHMVMQGKTETVEAVANAGYEFDRWSDGGSQKHTVTWSTHGQSITAYFRKKAEEKVTVSLIASPSAGGTVSGGGIHTKGTIRTVNATPSSGYRFVKWSDGKLQSHNVTWDYNKTLTAYFERYTVTGDEIFSGIELTSTIYWKVSGNATIVSVTSGVATIKINTLTDDTYFAFNKGYLGGKIEQGHKYRLTFQAKSSVSNTLILAIIASSLDISNSISSDILVYGEYNGGILSTSYKTITVEFTADVRDSSVSDGLLITSVSPATISIKGISLKEV